MFTRFLVAVLAGALCTACRTDTADRAATSASVQVTDFAARTVRIDKPAARVISFMPAVSDLIVAMRAQDLLIARTQYDVDPRLAHLPSTGNALNPNLEWIASLRPDLVITWPDQPSRSVIGGLERIGISSYAAAPETIDDILRVTRNLGVLLARESAADSLARAIRGQLDSVAAAVAGSPDVTVAFVFAAAPPMVAGPGTFVHEMIETAGGRNVFADSPARWPQVTLEEVLRRDPDVLLVNGVGEEAQFEASRIRTLPGWRELRAVRNGRIMPVDANDFTRPGPAVGRSAARIAAFLHPDRVR